MIHKLKNTTVRELIRALEQNGSNTKGAKEVKEFIAILGGMDKFICPCPCLFTRLTRINKFIHATLKSFLEGTKWNEDDLKRLRLIV